MVFVKSFICAYCNRVFYRAVYGLPSCQTVIRNRNNRGVKSLCRGLVLAFIVGLIRRSVGYFIIGIFIAVFITSDEQ